MKTHEYLKAHLKLEYQNWIDGGRQCSLIVLDSGSWVEKQCGFCTYDIIINSNDRLCEFKIAYLEGENVWVIVGEEKILVEDYDFFYNASHLEYSFTSEPEYQWVYPYFDEDGIKKYGITEEKYSSYTEVMQNYPEALKQDEYSGKLTKKFLKEP